MTYHVLIDENTSPRVAELLRGNGHEATHVTTTLQEGVSDREIADRVDRVSEYVPDPTDLPRITNLGSWE